MSDPVLKSVAFNHFIGVDVGKSHIVVFDGATQQTHKVDNIRPAIQRFFKAITTSPQTLVVCEASGGCETALLNGLSELGIAVHRANARHIKSFIASLGVNAKTDAGDAKAIAMFAQERHKRLKLWDVPDQTQIRLKNLVLRREDLVAMRKAEKNREKSPHKDKLIERSYRDLIAWINREIMKIEQAISRLMAESEDLTRKYNVLTAMKGIGSITAWTILAYMPELGKATRRQVASLAGLAPHPRDSGKTKGYRRTTGGRALLKRALFLPAMSAAKHDKTLSETYTRLLENGKKKLVALTAIMRKMIVIANARIRDDAISQLS